VENDESDKASQQANVGELDSCTGSFKSAAGVSGHKPDF